MKERKTIIKLEEAAMFAGSVYALSQYDVAWWWYLCLALAPDISMIGYAAGNKIGAVCYNVFHHKGIAIAVFLVGLLLHNDYTTLIGIVLFGHSSMDRMFGYGLKTEEGFKFTHLGTIGNK